MVNVIMREMRHIAWVFAGILLLAAAASPAKADPASQSLGGMQLESLGEPVDEAGLRDEAGGQFTGDPSSQCLPPEQQTAVILWDEFKQNGRGGSVTRSPHHSTVNLTVNIQ